MKFTRDHLLFRDVARHDLLRAQLIEGRCIEFTAHPNARFQEASVFARHLLQVHEGSFTLPGYCLGHLLSEGPKVFEFSARECEALENFDLGLPAVEYEQPFPTLLLKLPADYARTRVVEFPKVSAAPTDVIVRYEPGLLLIAVFFGDDDAPDDEHFSITCFLDLGRETTLEELWESYRDELPRLAPHARPEDRAVTAGLVRMSVAACTTLMAYGAKIVGPENEGHNRRLTSLAEVARKTGDQERIRNAEFDLETVPVRYEFAQQVRLYDIASEPASEEAGGGEGRVTRPHWRRGHFRNQAVGPGRSERKRIVIRPVLVNAHLFVGDRGDASVTYRLDPCGG